MLRRSSSQGSQDMFAASEVRRFVTRRGKALPFTLLGFGSAPLGNFPDPLTEESCDRTVGRAWDKGLRYYDTAPLYGLGLSENRVGRILGRHARDTYLLSTKVGRLLEPLAPGETFDTGIYQGVPKLKYVYDYSYDGVMRSLEFSLERLGLDQVDVVFGHDIDVTTHGSKDAADARFKEFMAGGYRALDELRGSGTIKAVGAGINEWEAGERLARAGDFDIFLLAGRYTLLEQEALTSFLPLCEEMKIAVVIGGPFNSGILATGVKADAHYNYGSAPDDVKDRVRRIQQICKRFKVRLPEAALRFPLGHPAVVSVIAGAQRASEVRRNAAMMSAKLPAALWRALKAEKLIREDAPTPR